MNGTLISAYVAALFALRSCQKHGNGEWELRWRERIAQLNMCLPHGSGLDGVVEFDDGRSDERVVRIVAEYHHMNADGYYDGWSTYTIVARASFLVQIDIRVDGRDRNGVKEHLTELFLIALHEAPPKFPWEVAAA